VRECKGVLTVWSVGEQVFVIEKRPRSQESVPHPEQWTGVASISAIRRPSVPLGHQQEVPQVHYRTLASYDQYCGVEAASEAGR
jgi:hypothetical protein